MRAFLLVLLALLCALPAVVRAQAVLRPGDQVIAQ